MNKDKETLEAAGGVPQHTVYPTEQQFELPDSGKKVHMRKPMLSDSIAAFNDKTVNQNNAVESTLAMFSLICTFDSKAVNYHDLKTQLSLVDYNYLASKYFDMVEPGKQEASS